VDAGTRAVVSLAQSVLGELDLDVVLERVLETSRDVTDAKYAALGLLDETRSELARFLTLGIDEATRREIWPLPRGRGVLGELVTVDALRQIVCRLLVCHHRELIAYGAGRPCLCPSLLVLGSCTNAYRPLRARSRTSPVTRILRALVLARAASVSSSESSRSSSQPRTPAICRRPAAPRWTRASLELPAGGKPFGGVHAYMDQDDTLL
jgi:hypothetical protein